MKAWALLIGLLTLPAFAAPPGCAACHPDLAAQLGPAHPKVKGDGIQKCLPCHDPARKGAFEAAKNPFAVKLHRGHGGVDCAVCHAGNGKTFSVKGAKKPLGKATADDLKAARAAFADVAGGRHLASAHAKAGVSCAGCHANRVPGKGDGVEDGRCLACHGPLDALVERTRPKEAHLPNPHKSHYGEMACTACHFGHQKSVVMCKDCHPKFKLTITHGE